MTVVIWEWPRIRNHMQWDGASVASTEARSSCNNQKSVWDLGPEISRRKATYMWYVHRNKKQPRKRTQSRERLGGYCSESKQGNSSHWGMTPWEPKKGICILLMVSPLVFKSRLKTCLWWTSHMSGFSIRQATICIPSKTSLYGWLQNSDLQSWRNYSQG